LLGPGLFSVLGGRYQSHRLIGIHLVSYPHRERAAEKKGPTANSINKVKDKVMNIQCAICKVRS
jgi:hypothetical protein